MSRWLVGSSSSSTSLPANRMRASSTRRRWPPLSAPSGSSSRPSARPRPSGQAMGLALGRVPAVESKALLSPAVPLHRLVGGLLLDGQAELLQAGGGLIQISARQDVAEGAGPLVHLVHPGVLRQVPEAAGDLHHPPVGIGLAGQHPQQRRLAGSVATGEAHLVAGAHGEAGVLEREHATDLDRELAHRQHGSSLAAGARTTASRFDPRPKSVEKGTPRVSFSTDLAEAGGGRRAAGGGRGQLTWRSWPSQ